jgi:hypothetical protein
MSVDANFNSQFIQIDFRLLDNPDFLDFVGRAEFATYLILRRYIWRGGEHRLGLHRLYAEEQKLAASIGGPRIAQLLQLKDRTQVSVHLSALVEQGVIQRIRTGRESIFILGEWHKPPGWDVSKEFYYLENRFGIAGSDIPAGATAQAGEAVDNSDLGKNPKSDVGNPTRQNWRKNPNNNRERNIEMNNTVNGVKLLPDLDVLAGEKEYLVGEMLTQLGDTHSKRFYELVAAKIPASHIIETLAQLRADGAESPAKLFTYRMHQYAVNRVRQGIGQLPRAA